MSNKRIEQWEIDRYWEIFATLSNGGSHLDGSQAASVLKNSQLRDEQLEKVWDLADVDNDGRLDFEEFCVAMRLIFDLVNGEYIDVPHTLPDWLVPESKAHLIVASSALSQPSHTSTFSSQSYSSNDDDVLKDDFDWYIAPTARSRYEEIYSAQKSPSTGILTFTSLIPFFESLDNSVPDTDVRSAWNLVNPRSEEGIGKDAAIAFLHVLSNRSEGYRIPRNVPASLRATFESQNVNERTKTAEERWGMSSLASDRRRNGDEEQTLTGKKKAFGDAYLSRLGIGDRGGRAGTDFSGTKTDKEWEEVRLKKKLRELEEKIEKVGDDAKRRRDRTGRGERESKPALVKRELEMLLNYKRKQLNDLDNDTDGGDNNQAKILDGLSSEISMVKEQVEGLEKHLKTREAVLEGLRIQIEDEKMKK